MNESEIKNFLRSFGWSENRCVDVSNLQFGLQDDTGDMDFIGDKFHMFDTAEKFLQNFGGLKFIWKTKDNKLNLDDVLEIGGDKTLLRVKWLKWYMISFRRLLYPVATFPPLMSDLLIDIYGNFYLVDDVYVCDAGDNFFILLDDLINSTNKVTKRNRVILDWEDAGYTDEFIEQWNYDFDEIPDIPEYDEE